MDKISAAEIIDLVILPRIPQILTGFHHKLEIGKGNPLRCVRNTHPLTAAVLGQVDRFPIHHRIARELVITLPISCLRIAHRPVHLVLPTVIRPLVVKPHRKLHAGTTG